MRAFVGIAVLIISPAATRAQAAPPEACYVAQVAIIVDDVADFKYHRVVVAGIRQLDPMAGATPGNCESRNAAAVSAMRTAVRERLDSVVVTPPRLRATIELRHANLDVVRSEITRIARLARDHSGTFTRVERVAASELPAALATQHALPRLSHDDATTASCENDNAALERAGAKFRWAC